MPSNKKPRAKARISPAAVDHGLSAAEGVATGSLIANIAAHAASLACEAMQQKLADGHRSDNLNPFPLLHTALLEVEEIFDAECADVLTNSRAHSRGPGPKVPGEGPRPFNKQPRAKKKD